MRVELGFIEGYHESSREAVLRAAEAKFGPPDPKESEEPKEDNPFRGGPHLIGKVHRRVWKLDLRADYITSSKNWSQDVVRSLDGGVRGATFQLHWADKLPFVVAYIALDFDPAWRPERGGQALFIQYAFDDLFGALDGIRLSPNNRHPRTASRWLIGAKVTQDRLDAMQASLKAGARDSAASEAFRTNLRELVPVVGQQAGALLATVASSNYVFVTGEGWGGEVGEAGGAFTAFLFSNGNLISEDGWPQHLLPLWPPQDVRFTMWQDARFVPFMICAHRFAQHTLIEAGPIEEALDQLVDRFQANSSEGNRKTRAQGWMALQQDLLRMQGQVQRLELKLHMSAQRTLTKSLEDNLKAALGRGDTLLVPSEPDLFFFSDTRETWVTHYADGKKGAEQEARDLLVAHNRRIKDMLDVATGDVQLYASDSMRKWGVRSAWIAIVSALLGLAGVVVAVVALLARRGP